MVVRRWRAGYQEGPQPLDITLERTTGSGLIGNRAGFPVGRRGPENLLVQLAQRGRGQCRCPIRLQRPPASPSFGQRAHGGVGVGGKPGKHSRNRSRLESLLQVWGGGRAPCADPQPPDAAEGAWQWLSWWQPPPSWAGE